MKILLESLAYICLIIALSLLVFNGTSKTYAQQCQDSRLGCGIYSCIPYDPEGGTCYDYTCSYSQTVAVYVPALVSSLLAKREDAATLFAILNK